MLDGLLRVRKQNAVWRQLVAKNDMLELTFLGTRGEIEIRSRRHHRHSALLIVHKKARIMINCGADWLGRLPILAPTQSSSRMLISIMPEGSFMASRARSMPPAKPSACWLASPSMIDAKCP